jgi:NAD+ kinase
MNNFIVMTNSQKDEGLALSKKISDYITSHGRICTVIPDPTREETIQSGIYENIGEDVDCALVLGGDGTFIRAARILTERDIPLIGVNLGTLGYLCELEEETLFSAIDQLFEDVYTVEERMLLSGCEFEDGQQINVHAAFNDIVIYRAGSLSIIKLKLFVNGQELCTYHADGLILSTPSGSTAYNMSAGGPIVDPKAELIVVTPISAQAMNAKSLVLCADDEIVIEVVPRDSKKKEEVEVAFDGDNALRLRVGDKIYVRKGQMKTKILHLGNASFLEILRKKMYSY